MSEKVKYYITSRAIPFFRDKMIYYPIKEKFMPNQGIVIFGLYNNEDFQHILKNNSKMKIILWGGSDLIKIKNNLFRNTEEIVNKIKNDETIYNLCQSRDHYNIMANLNFNRIYYKKLFLTNNKELIENFMGVKEYGKNIYAYDGYGKNDVYNIPLLHQLDKLLPEFNFIYSSKCRREKVEQAEMHKVYEKCFIALRLTEYDGNGMTTFECGLCGIPTIHNGDFPDSIPWSKDNINEIIDNIRKVSNWNNEQRKKLKEKYFELFMNSIKDDWLNPSFYK